MRGGNGVKWTKVEGVFIGLESSGRLVLNTYVWYLYTAVQMLFCMIRYYLVDSMNSVAYVRCTVHIVRLYYLSERTSGGGPSYVHIIDNSVCSH